MRNQEPGTRNKVESGARNQSATGNGVYWRGFRNLRAWELSDDLASLVFDIAQKLPSQHRWLASQMCRAAVSVPANIAEGYGRGSIGDYLRFLDIARGSLSEVEYYIHFAVRKQLIPPDEGETVERLRDETSRVLFGLWQSLKAMLPAKWDHSGITRRIGEEPPVYDLSEVFGGEEW